MPVNAKLIGLSVLLALGACERGPAETPRVGPPPARVTGSSADVARLAADRAALDDAHARCKARAADAKPELCAAAAEATRRRFSAPASPYAPGPVEPFPSERR